MVQLKDNLNPEQLERVRFLRQMLLEPKEKWNGKLEQAKRKADEVAERTGMKTFVIRRKRKYDWVAEAFFDAYDYKGKIYYETNPNLDAEV